MNIATVNGCCCWCLLNGRGSVDEKQQHVLSEIGHSKRFDLLSAASSREACLLLAAQLSCSFEPLFENNFNELRHSFNSNNSRGTFKTKQRADG